MSDELRAALIELVTLKDIKDRDGKTEDYERRQPLAWEAARSALARPPAPDAGARVIAWWRKQPEIGADLRVVIPGDIYEATRQAAIDGDADARGEALCVCGHSLKQHVDAPTLKGCLMGGMGCNCLEYEPVTTEGGTP